MAYLSIPNVKVVGVSAAVPHQVIKNIGTAVQSTDYAAEDFVATTGVIERHVDEICTSDLCYEAAKALIAEKWNNEKKDIDAIIFCSQTADYIEPCTACILQDRLGLSKECFATDITLGCSGWVYGLSMVASLMQTGTIKKALLLAGDAKGRLTKELLEQQGIPFRDPLFGCAGTATALEYEPNCTPLNFHLGTDGSGYDAIIVKDGGARNPLSATSLQPYELDGKQTCDLCCQMKGMDVFSFGISTAPKSVKRLAEKYNYDYLNDFDYYIFHQANMKMNSFISKKLKLDEEKVPYSLPHYGNTSSASIPLTMVTEIRQSLSHGKKHLLCCGFGIGLSWGTVAIETENLVIPELIEVDNNEL